MGCGCGGNKLSNIAQNRSVAVSGTQPAPSGYSSEARVVQAQAFTGGVPLQPVTVQGQITLKRSQV